MTSLATVLALAVGLTALPSAFSTTGPPGASSGAPVAGAAGAGAWSTTSGAAREQVLRDYRAMPLAFVQNAGQADKRARFLSQGGGYGFFFTQRGVMLTFSPPGADRDEAGIGWLVPSGLARDPFSRSRSGRRGVALELRFLGANPNPKAQIVASERAPGTVSYLDGGRDDAQAGLASYRELTYRDVWPGIDVSFRGNRGRLKYEFHVAAGADPNDIALAYRGADGLSLTAGGALAIATPLGTLIDARPVSYQRAGAARTPVQSRYRLRGARYGFALPARYDRSRPLVIDPGLTYSTFLGGTTDDQGPAIAVDAQGSAYITGSTSSSDYPTSAGAYDGVFNGGGTDVFVTKLTASGTGIAYSTFLGGTSFDYGGGVAVDGQGSAYVTGRTMSSDYPTSAGAYDTSFNGGLGDVFVTKLTASGAGIAYSTFLGGTTVDEGNAVAVDGQGSAHVTGWTGSSDYPTSAAAYDTSFNGGSTDVFVTKLTASGAGIAYSTFLGGTTVDGGGGVAVDGQGSAYVTGSTSSSDYPTSAGAYDTSFNGVHDVFVTKLTASGAGIAYSTFLGGTNVNDDGGVAVDGQGSAYVTGWTNSSDYPTTAGAYDRSFNGGGTDVFVTKLTASGAGIAYSTFLGGTRFDQGGGVAVDGQGSAYVTGSTSSSDYPTSAGAYDTSFNGGSYDVFVTKLTASGAEIAHSTFLGGTDLDGGEGVAVDGQGSAYVTGTARSSDYPISAGAYDTTFNGNVDVFVTKLDWIAPDTTITGGVSGPTNSVSQSFTFGSNEAGASFECRLDAPTGAGSYAPCSSPQTYLTLVNGSYAFWVRAADTSGNQDPTPATRIFTVDTVAPEATITDGPTGTTSETAPSFSFTASEAATFQCKLDGPTATLGEYRACTSPLALGPLSSGAYTFSLRATDAAGNTDSTPDGRAFTVQPNDPRPCGRAGRSDGQAVGVTVANVGRYTNDPNVELTIVAPDGATGLLISNDGGFTQPFAGPVNLGRRYPWTLDSSGPERLPKTVYVRFAGACVDASQTFTDDIILDQTPPKLPRPTVQAPTKGRRGPLILQLKATDNASGVRRVEVRRAKARIFAARYKRKIRLTGSPNQLTVRVKDGAGNNTSWKKAKVIRKGRTR